MIRSFMFSTDVRAVKMDKVPVATNRYDAKIILSTSNGDYTRVLRLDELKSNITATDQYMNIDLRYQYDPFRIAYDAYGNESLYWVILAANDLFSMFDLIEGTTVRIPNILAVLGYDGLVVRGDEL